jgi:Tol biopolymer transport system component
MNADGSGQTKLAQVFGFGVAWSPLGDRFVMADARDRNGEICFHECADAGELYTLAADGTGPVRITTTEANEANPSWSPDATAIAFTSDRTNPDEHDDELYLARPDGTCVTQLTSNKPDVTESSPAWRPTANMARARLTC